MIDFYFACTDFLAYAIAACLNAWCFEANGSTAVLARGAHWLGAHPAASRCFRRLKE